MTRKWMIYGATGYTGRLLVEEAIRRGLDPVLAGRDATQVAKLAGRLGLEHRAAGLEDARRLARSLDGIAAVLNAAGPFTATAGPLSAACLARGAHYLDLTGEIPVFAALRRLDAAARSRGILLMPGAGYVVVPSDCLAAHVAQRLPGARWLRLGISRYPLLSRGSARTMAELTSQGAEIRRNGRMCLLPWCNLERWIDYGDGPRGSLVIGWPDVYTAYYTTGIPNIEACLEVDAQERLFFLGSRYFAPWLQSPPWQAALKARADLLPEGPSAAERARYRRVIVAIAGDAAGHRAASRLRTPEPYTLTVLAALEIMAKVLAGEVRSGFQTPAGLLGADFVLSLPDVWREDLDI